MVSDPRLGGHVPRNIVYISFNAEATQAQRQEAIGLVDGEVLGGVRIHDGGWYYVRITDDGTAQSLLDALDLLESLPQVRIASPQLPEGVPGSAVPREPFELHHTDEQGGSPAV